MQLWGKHTHINPDQNFIEFFIRCEKIVFNTNVHKVVKRKSWKNNSFVEFSKFQTKLLTTWESQTFSEQSLFNQNIFLHPISVYIFIMNERDCSSFFFNTNLNIGMKQSPVQPTHFFLVIDFFSVYNLYNLHWIIFI